MEPPPPSRAEARASVPGADWTRISPLALILAGFAISFVVIGGGIDTVGVFLSALVREAHWPSSTLSLGVSVGATVAALATPWVGSAIDRRGIRVPMAAGVTLLALGFAVVVAMQAPWQFVVANLFLGAGFAACSFLPITVAITLRIPDRTAFALGVVGAGESLGALVLAPAVQRAIEALGWRGAYVALGAAVLLTPIPLIALVFPAGRVVPAGLAGAPTLGANLSWREVASGLRRPGVLPLAAIMILPSLVAFALSVHLVPYLVSCGLGDRAAATALGAVVGISGAGKLLGGWIGDRFGPLATLRVALIAVTLALLALPFAARPGALGAFLLLYGLGGGAEIAVLAPLARRVLGTEGFGTLYGTLQLGSLLAAALGPVAAGLIVDRSGTYEEVIRLWVLCLALAAGFALAMRAPRRER